MIGLEALVISEKVYWQRSRLQYRPKHNYLLNISHLHSISVFDATRVA